MKELFKDAIYPWEILPKIEEFIIKLGNKLDSEIYEKIDENIWIAKTAKIAKSASITGPAIIDENAEIRHCAFIRGKAIIGKNTVVGNSTELKNVILYEIRPINYNRINTGKFYLNYNEFGVKKRCYSNLRTLKIGLAENKDLKINP